MRGIFPRIIPLPEGLTSTSRFSDPEVTRSFTIRTWYPDNKERETNWDGSAIDPDNIWHREDVSVAELLEKDFGKGPYCPDFSGADYSKVVARLLAHAQTSAFPPERMATERREDHIYGKLFQYDCSCCFSDHWTSDCPIFCSAELRRLLFTLRGLCLSCRQRHQPNQGTCYIYLRPLEYPLCGERGCKGLPKHHRCLCSLYTEDLRTVKKMIEGGFSN